MEEKRKRSEQTYNTNSTSQTQTSNKEPLTSGGRPQSTLCLHWPETHKAAVSSAHPETGWGHMPVRVVESRSSSGPSLPSPSSPIYLYPLLSPSFPLSLSSTPPSMFSPPPPPPLPLSLIQPKHMNSPTHRGRVSVVSARERHVKRGECCTSW